MADEKELVKKLKDGDRDAYRFVIKEYRNLMYASIVNILGSCSEVEDIGQEIFIRLFKSIQSFKGESKLSTYLCKIAINLSLNELKRRQKRVFMSIESSGSDRIAGVHLPKDSDFENKELIQMAMQKIDTDYKTVLHLRLIHGYSTKETADILDIPQGTVLSRLSRGQKKLHHEIKSLMGEET